MSEANLTGGGGGGVPICGITYFPHTEDCDVTVKGQRFLRTGYIETDPAKFDAAIWAKTKGTMLTQIGSVTTMSSNRVVSDIQSNGNTLVAFFSHIAGSEPEFVVSTNGGATWSLYILALGMSSKTMYGIDYGASKWVAVGNDGKIATAPDGVTWTARTSNVSALLRRVHWNGSLFVAVGSGVIVTSPDGITWTSRTLPAGLTGADIHQIAYGNGMWVAVGGSSVCATSPDGITWTQRTIATSGISSVTITFDTATNKFYVGGGGKLLSSADGAVWELLMSTNGPEYSGLSDWGAQLCAAYGYFYWGNNTVWARTKDGKTTQPLYSQLLTTQIRLCKALRNGMVVVVQSNNGSHLLARMNDAAYAGYHSYVDHRSASYAYQALPAYVRIS